MNNLLIEALKKHGRRKLGPFYSNLKDFREIKGNYVFEPK